MNFGLNGRALYRKRALDAKILGLIRLNPILNLSLSVTFKESCRPTRGTARAFKLTRARTPTANLEPVFCQFWGCFEHANAKI